MFVDRNCTKEDFEELEPCQRCPGCNSICKEFSFYDDAYGSNVRLSEITCTNEECGIYWIQ